VVVIAADFDVDSPARSTRSSMGNRAVVGVDVGGTFTDLFFLDGGDPRPRIVKVPTTSPDPSAGVIDALERAEIDAPGLSQFLHGTTIATNALIERRGATCALITTTGFRDILELGRRDRPHIYGLSGKHKPLIARDQRWEADERIDHRGNVLVKLDEQRITELAAGLRGEGLQTIVVCFLHSYVNPAHEERARELLLAVEPRWHVVISSAVLSEYYEFERTSTAVVQGYLQPLVTSYATRLGERLSSAGFRGEALIMQSNGGLIPASRAGEQASHIVRSGPAAGVIAATRLANEAGFDRVITGDMGGTSFDVAVSLGGQLTETDTALLDFRMPVRVPMLDVRTIGAGGGSIAWLDRAGILQVGPRSAGSDPGPAALGRGGSEPTVTDANLVLGRINDARPIGAGSLYLHRARAALGALGEKLGMNPEEMASAVLKVVNARMAGEIRLVTIEHGQDPREFALVCFGGAGPLHGAALLGELQIGVMLVPAVPGVLCAMGCALADVRYDFSQTVERTLPRASDHEPGTLDPADLDAVLTAQRERGMRRLQRDGMALASVEVRHLADMSYQGQVHRLRVPVETAWDGQRLRAAFIERHRREFGTDLGDLDVRLVSARTTVLAKQPRRHLEHASPATGTPMPCERRPVHFEEWVQTPVYAREDLRPGAELEGPMIVEQDDTTTVIEPGMHVRVDRLANLVVTL
jgi:N-methylhydantoinase A